MPKGKGYSGAGGKIHKPMREARAGRSRHKPRKKSRKRGRVID
jgi:hypothetical protein